MSNVSVSSLASVYAQLTSFANLSNFWSLFNTAFGSSYDSVKAATFKYQWQNQDFSLFPQIEVVSNGVLGSANGAYAISTNRIYLSDQFVSVASQQSLEAVILEEFGHFMDAQVNATDTAGDEGELFSVIVRGVSLSAAELSRIKTEDDHAIAVIGGQATAIEMANGQVNLITNGSFEIGSDPESFLPLDPGSTAITGWTITRDQIDYEGSLWIDADGSRSIDLNGTPGVGGIAQTFNTIAGQQYLVSFALAGNPAAGNPIKQLEVSAAGQSEAFSFDTTGFSYNNMGWVNKTWVFTATASTTTLEFYSLSIEPENALFGPTLDNVCVISLLPSITLAVAPASVTEDSTTNLVYTFTRTGSTTNTLTVNYRITGTADATDYTGATPGTGKTITFTAGSSTATLTIDPTADTTIESDETVALTLATAISYTVGTTTAVTGTIINDDPTITLVVSPASVLEDGTPNLVYTFTRTGLTTSALTVNYNIAGIADATDYTGATPGTGKTITFTASSATATLTLDPTADTTIEANETVALSLATGTGYTVGTTTAVTGTIINDDPTITLAVTPASVLEDGTPNLVYTFTRTGVTTNALTVNYGITGTATNGTDYATIGTSVTFVAGSSTATVNVNPTPDTVIEANETVALTLATGTGYTIGTTTAVTGTIINDDPTITLGLNFSGISENSPSNFVYTFTRTGSTTNALTANYSIAGTALSTDYTGATPGIGKTITFVAGSAIATLTIDPTADTTLETDETISLQLATGNGYTIGTTAAQIATIINDDRTRRQKGTNGKDVILGTNLSDILSGGLGNDVLTGGLGGDSFSFNALNEGIDTITDFSVGNDDLFVKGSGFGGGLVSGDILIATQFVIGTAATNTSQRFIYNSTNGALFFDVDGNGATAASQFAILNPNLALNYQDIFVI